MSLHKARRLSAHLRESRGSVLRGADLGEHAIEPAAPGGLASRLTERLRALPDVPASVAAEDHAPSILRPAVERLLDCEAALRAVRRQLIHRDPAVTDEVFETAIDGAIAILVATRALGRDPDQALSCLGRADPSL